MLNGSGLTTSLAALANTVEARMPGNPSVLAGSGNSAGGFSALVVGIVLLFILAIVGGGIVFVRRKKADSWEEPVNQRSSTFSDARSLEGRMGQMYRTQGGVSSSNEGYGGVMGGAQQESWPWAKKMTPPAGYNPTTPVPEMLRAPANPMTSAPGISEMPAYNASLMQNMPEASYVPVVSTAPAMEMQGFQGRGLLRSLSTPAPVTPAPAVPNVHSMNNHVQEQSANYGREPSDLTLMTPLPQVPEAPSVALAAPVSTQQNPLQLPSVPVPDAELEAIMRQVQVGLFALPRQHRGQKDQ